MAVKSLKEKQEVEHHPSLHPKAISLNMTLSGHPLVWMDARSEFADKLAARGQNCTNYCANSSHVAVPWLQSRLSQMQNVSANWRSKTRQL